MKNKMPNYHIITFGCQMNENDSERIAGMLENYGYLPTDERGEADLIAVNTCCVRETAENKVFSLLGRLGQIKKQNPNLLICLGGCMSQQEHMGQEIKKRFPYVDIVFGTQNMHMLPDLIDRAKNEKKQIIDVWTEARTISEGLPVKRKGGVRAWVPITYGCNNYCTYCIVPYVRGRERSRQPEAVLQEIEELGRLGYIDITLLGQNVNSYGKDLNNGIDFAWLLSEIDKINGVDRIRFMTSHPRDFCDKLVKTMARLPKVCEHIHLPVQSGSNRILKLMNRGYTREDYFALVEKIRLSIPEVALTTDIMVGFPDETDVDFAQTVELVKKVEFESAFTFIYNKRKGTPAAKMDNQVVGEVKSARIQELVQIQNEISLGKNRGEIGKTLDCLVEGPSKTKADLMSARTRTNKIVVFRGGQELVGQILPLRIINYSFTHLDGMLV